MNRPAKEWIVKAEGDYATALRELRARKNPNYDAACFHAQQCIEKYLKGILQARQIGFTRTHDLCLLRIFQVLTYLAPILSLVCAGLGHTLAGVARQHAIGHVLLLEGAIEMSVYYAYEIPSSR